MPINRGDPSGRMWNVQIRRKDKRKGGLKRCKGSDAPPEERALFIPRSKEIKRKKEKKRRVKCLR